MSALSNLMHEKFCVAYVACSGNGAEAARRCGLGKLESEPGEYKSRKAARALLQREDIQDRVEELASDKMQVLHIHANDVLSELHRIANVNPRDAFDPATNEMLPIHDMPLDVQKAISSIKVEELFAKGVRGEKIKVGYVKEVKFWTKTQALEMLARTLALFKDSLTISDESTDLDENARAARAASLFDLARRRRDSGDDLV